MVYSPPEGDHYNPNMAKTIKPSSITFLMKKQIFENKKKLHSDYGNYSRIMVISI